MLILDSVQIVHRNKRKQSQQCSKEKIKQQNSSLIQRCASSIRICITLFSRDCMYITFRFLWRGKYSQPPILTNTVSTVCREKTLQRSLFQRFNFHHFVKFTFVEIAAPYFVCIFLIIFLAGGALKFFANSFMCLRYCSILITLRLQKWENLIFFSNIYSLRFESLSKDIFLSQILAGYAVYALAWNMCSITN